MDSKQLSLPKMEDMNEFDWSFLEKQTQGILDEKSAFSGSHNYNMNSSVEVDQWQNLCFNNPINTHFEFMNGFEEFGGEIFLSDDVNMNSSFFLDFPLIDAKPLSSYLDTNFDQHSDNVQNVSMEKNFDWEAKISRQSGRSSKSAALELDEINKYFDVPITKAAKELKVGLTVLKKRCRELNIMRWPHRKIKSLKSLILNVKELGMTTEIEMLEEHRKMLEKLPELELTERTKKLRQACFKANYKKRRSLQALTY